MPFIEHFKNKRRLFWGSSSRSCRFCSRFFIIITIRHELKVPFGHLDLPHVLLEVEEHVHIFGAERVPVLSDQVSRPWEEPLRRSRWSWNAVALPCTLSQERECAFLSLPPTQNIHLGIGQPGEVQVLLNFSFERCQTSFSPSFLCWPGSFHVLSEFECSIKELENAFFLSPINLSFQPHHLNFSFNLENSK